MGLKVYHLFVSLPANNKTGDNPHQGFRPSPDIIWESCTGRFCREDYGKRRAIFFWCYFLFYIMFCKILHCYVLDVGYQHFNISCSIQQIVISNIYEPGPALVFEGEEDMLAAISEDPSSFKVRKTVEDHLDSVGVAAAINAEIGIRVCCPPPKYLFDKINSECLSQI